jgi:CDP-diacylglycerol--glycerol-3-phosphate 3-phosphatidyltransferase
MKINLPNQITIGRLVLAIVFFVILGRYRHGSSADFWLDIALVIFLVAAISDIVDGWLARRTGEVTSLGRVLDPFVDKVLVCGAYIFYAGPAFVDERGHSVTGVWPWMVVLIIARELLVSGLRGFSESQGQAFGANAIGKAKMVTQSVTACLILLVLGYFEEVPAIMTFMRLCVWITVVVTALSLVAYLARSKHILADATRS